MTRLLHSDASVVLGIDPTPRDIPIPRQKLVFIPGMGVQMHTEVTIACFVQWITLAFLH